MIVLLIEKTLFYGVLVAVAVAVTIANAWNPREKESRILTQTNGFLQIVCDVAQLLEVRCEHVRLVRIRCHGIQFPCVEVPSHPY